MVIRVQSDDAFTCTACAGACRLGMCVGTDGSCGGNCMHGFSGDKCNVCEDKTQVFPACSKADACDITLISTRMDKLFEDEVSYTASFVAVFLFLLLLACCSSVDHSLFL